MLIRIFLFQISVHKRGDLSKLIIALFKFFHERLSACLSIELELVVSKDRVRVELGTKRSRNSLVEELERA